MTDRTRTGTQGRTTRATRAEGTGRALVAPRSADGPLLDQEAVRAYGRKVFEERRALLRAASRARTRTYDLVDHPDPHVALKAAALIFQQGLPPWTAQDRALAVQGQAAPAQDSVQGHLDAMMVFARARQVQVTSLDSQGRAQVVVLDSQDTPGQGNGRAGQPGPLLVGEAKANDFNGLAGDDLDADNPIS